MQPPKNRQKRVIGIDFGLARFGLALSDERQIIATPFQTVQAERKTELTIAKILALLAQLQESHSCEIEEIIVGLPLMMNGRTGFQADEV